MTGKYWNSMSNRPNIRFWAFIVMLFVNCLTAGAQQFYNLTADEVRIDTVLPRFSCSIPLQGQYADSVYSVRILYPDFVQMTPYSERRLRAITDQPLPVMPEVETRIVVERRKASLEVLFVPLVRRENKNMMLVSFMLQVEAQPRQSSMVHRAPKATEKR